MSERERWIVYPLLFFALGAALRDKFLQQVTTKELHCERVVADSIACDALGVFDPERRGEALVELGVGERAGEPGRTGSERLGVLILRDTQGKELCSVSNDAMFVRQIVCEGLRVVDPQAHERMLAALDSIDAPATKEGGKPQRVAIFALNDEETIRLSGSPLSKPKE